MSDFDFVCNCMMVSEKQIRERIAAGDRTEADLSASLSVCRGCGCCRPKIEDLLAECCQEVRSESA